MKRLRASVLQEVMERDAMEIVSAVHGFALGREGYEEPPTGARKDFLGLAYREVMSVLKTTLPPLPPGLKKLKAGDREYIDRIRDAVLAGECTIEQGRELLRLMSAKLSATDMARILERIEHEAETRPVLRIIAPDDEVEDGLDWETAEGMDDD